MVALQIAYLVSVQLTAKTFAIYRRVNDSSPASTKNLGWMKTATWRRTVDNAEITLPVSNEVYDFCKANEGRTTYVSSCELGRASSGGGADQLVHTLTLSAATMETFITNKATFDWINFRP